MTLSAAFLAFGSVLGLLGFAVLVVATVVMSAADLAGHDLFGPADRTGHAGHAGHAGRTGHADRRTVAS